MNLTAKQEPATNFPLPGRLQAYNRLVLQYQEEAYSLAFDLVGDEVLASEITEEAFLHEFSRKNDNQAQFRLEVMRLVIQGCRRRSQVLPCPQFFEGSTAKLSNDEKLVCILVDCLELSYQETASVLGKPLASIRKILAETRFKLIAGAIGKDNG